MIRKSLNVFSLAAACCFMLSGAASAECLPAKGKITNNGQMDGSTLGVVALGLGANKYKCGIHGVPQNTPYPSFYHTVVCDDKAGAGQAQAQITFNTVVVSQSDVVACEPGSPGGPYSFSFDEVSTPIPATGRGAFSGVTAGSISIQGHYNCQGGITMGFAGQLCMGE